MYMYIYMYIYTYIYVSSSSSLPNRRVKEDIFLFCLAHVKILSRSMAIFIFRIFRGILLVPHSFRRSTWFTLTPLLSCMVLCCLFFNMTGCLPTLSMTGCWPTLSCHTLSWHILSRPGCCHTLRWHTLSRPGCWPKSAGTPSVALDACTPSAGQT